MIHSVAGVEDQQGWGNVMYIPASLHREKNAARCEEAFRTGASPGDFALENHEAGWV